MRKLQPIDRHERSVILRGFVLSPEHARLTPCERELGWVEELLDAMDSAGWSWTDLDRETFAAFLLDSLRFSSDIEGAPDDSARVGRLLDAFLTFAGREYDAPHAEECCAFLRSGGGADLESRVAPAPAHQDSRSQSGSLSP